MPSGLCPSVVSCSLIWRMVSGLTGYWPLITTTGKIRAGGGTGEAFGWGPCQQDFPVSLMKDSTSASSRVWTLTVPEKTSESTASPPSRSGVAVLGTGTRRRRLFGEEGASAT